MNKNSPFRFLFKRKNATHFLIKGKPVLFKIGPVDVIELDVVAKTIILQLNRVGYMNTPHISEEKLICNVLNYLVSEGIITETNLDWEINDWNVHGCAAIYYF